jgi:hypothetical protein
MTTQDVVESAELRYQTVEAERALIFLFDYNRHIWKTFL